MARLLNKKIRLTGVLKTLTPLSIGSTEETNTEDVSVMRNGADEIYIPGTSIAGAIRTQIDDHNLDFWGSSEDNGSASLVTFFDAILETGSTEIRDGVGIGRIEGRAASGVKFDREMVCAGAKFSFAVEVEILSDNDPAEKLLQNLRWLLESGRLRLGGAVSRGLGKVKLIDGNVEILPLNNKEDFLKALEKGNWQPAELDAAKPDGLPPLLTINIDWTPKGAIMVKAGEDGAVVDTIPLVVAGQNENGDEEWRQVIPGSSTKGVFRSHSERIMRTVMETIIDVKDHKNTSNAFNKIINSDPLVNALFGTAREDDEKDDEFAHQGRSAIRVDDTLTDGTISTALQDVLRGIGTSNATNDLGTLARELSNANNSDAWPDTQAAMHVVVDRWTGGAAPNLLFSRLEPLRPKFQPITMEIDLDRLAKATNGNQLAALTLFLLTLRSFMDGEMPLGYGGTRGLGAIEVTHVKFTLDGSIENSGLSDLIAGLCENQITPDTWNTEEFSKLIEPMIEAWKLWVDPKEEAA